MNANIDLQKEMTEIKQKLEATETKLNSFTKGSENHVPMHEYLKVKSEL